MNPNWFFEKINIINKLVTRLIKKKLENTQISSLRNERLDSTTDPINIKRTSEHSDQLYPHKLAIKIKWTNHLKDTSYQTLLKKKLNSSIFIFKNWICSLKKKTAKLPTKKTPRLNDLIHW